jgi:hypothetical protein
VTVRPVTLRSTVVSGVFMVITRPLPRDLWGAPRAGQQWMCLIAHHRRSGPPLSDSRFWPKIGSLPVRPRTGLPRMADVDRQELKVTVHSLP